MGSTQGEIRVGPSHQAKLPENRLNVNAADLSPDPEFSKEREEVRWVSSLTLDGDLVMYLRAARSMAAFAGMCDGGSAEDGCIAASRDGTTINAMDVLHDSGYDPGKALQALVKCPMPKSIEKKWTEEETKRFVKGLRQFGKNFFRIKKDLLPHKDTPELVEFYYLWKKMPGANNNRPHRRRRQSSLRRNRNTRNTRGGTQKEEVSSNSSRPSPGSKDQADASSGSDDDNDNNDNNDNSYDDSDSRENGGYRCSHCLTTSSRDWLHASNSSKQGALLCSNCRTYYKQYNELPPTSKNEAYLFQPLQTESPEGSPGRMRTRNKIKETPTKEKSSKSKRSETATPEPEVDLKPFSNSVPECRSPVSGVSTPSEKSNKKRKTETGSNRKRANIVTGEDEPKRKREMGPDSGSEESDTESLFDLMDVASPSQNTDEKPLNSETPVPPALPDAESITVDNGELKQKSTDSIAQSQDRYPVADLPEVVQASDGESAAVENGSPDTEMAATSFPDSTKEAISSNMDLVMPLQEPFEYEKPPNGSVKNEAPFDSPSPTDRDEILPPVLTSEESYVPKDEMPTLHANTNLAADPMAGPTAYPADMKYAPSYVSQMEMMTDAIKMEPGLQMTDENSVPRTVQKPVQSESLSQRVESPPPFGAQPINASSQPFSRDRPESPRTMEMESDKSMGAPPMMMPAYGMYNDSDRNEKGASNMSLGSLNLSHHHPAYASYYHYPPHPAHGEKMETSPYLGVGLQMEPQDLKIKQESLPLDQQGPLLRDPLQSLKEVKVPGYSDTCISQPLLPVTTSSSTPTNTVESHSATNRLEATSPFMSNVQGDDIKKESESYAPARGGASLKSPSLHSSKLSSESSRSVAMSPKLSHTPPYQFTAQPLVSQPLSIRTPSASPVNTLALAGLAAHSAQPPSSMSRSSPAHMPHSHAYMPPMHPHQHYLSPSLLAAAAAHAQVAAAAAHHNPYSHHPYGGYPYPFPYPYPIPQPIPPPRALENPKREAEAAATLVASHHSSSSSSSVMTRSVRDEDSHSQEITQTHHHSSSHRESIHHHNEKQTISHSSSSSASVQHKVKRSSSPQHSSSSCHVSATLSRSTSSSLSTNHGQNSHHSHHHQHTHHHQSASGERLSPLMGMSMPLGPNQVIPPHHSALSLSGLPPSTGSLEALRAHAHAAANIHSPLLQPSPHAPADEGEIPSPNNYIPKGPSPEPKIEDSECHRSQSAIFLRHWNRGDFNSCARTDLTFKAVPDSKLDRKRQERIRKQAEKEREEREKSQARKVTATPDKPETTKPPSRGPIETISSPYDRFARGTPYGGDTPALRQLSEYARPHTGFSPVALPRSAATLGLPPQCVDPMLHYQLNMYGGHTPRERLEIEHYEREKRERELREMQIRDKEIINERLKEELIKSAAAGSRLQNAIDPHWLDLQRRYGALAPSAPAGGLHPFGLYAAAGQASSLTPLERERLERLGSAAGAYPRPGVLPSREAALGIHHADLLARPYADQLAQQAAAHEHMQRQILMERERYAHPLAVQQQHEEYLRELELAKGWMRSWISRGEREPYGNAFSD